MFLDFYIIYKYDKKAISIFLLFQKLLSRRAKARRSKRITRNTPLADISHRQQKNRALNRFGRKI